MARLPDVVIELPPDWRWQKQDGPPLGLEPSSGAGVLQISSPASATGWRGANLDALVRQFVIGSKLGEVVRVEEADVAYGRMVQAEAISKEFGDVAAWMLVHDTHDPLVVTWIADTPSDDGKTARALVRTIAPGAFSRVVDMIVSTVRGGVSEKGGVDYHAVLVADGVITTAYFHGMPDEIEREAMRAETKRLRATVAARVGMAQVHGRDGAELVAFVHVESPSLKKRFFVPQAERGRVAHEVSAEGVAITDFFLEPDPRVVAALTSSRKPPP